MKHKKEIRLIVLAVLIPVTTVLIMLTMYVNQIVKAEYYAEKAASGAVYESSIPAARGQILDRNGVVLASNKTVYSLQINKLYVDSDKLNDTILWAVELLNSAGEAHNDTLPISGATQTGYSFLEGYDDEISYLKNTYKLNVYATADQCMDKLIEEFELEDYTPQQQRWIAGVRYEMVLRGYSNSLPFTLADEVSISTVTVVSENSRNYPGIEVVEGTVRSYTDGTIAPHLLGYVAAISETEYESKKDEGYELNSKIGKSGIEKQYESILKGEDGELTTTRGEDGTVISSEVTKEAVAGGNVYLTIDSRLQADVNALLQQYITSIANSNGYGDGGDCNAGTIVVLDTQTGEVLAAASNPTYDVSTLLENWSEIFQIDTHPLNNRAFSGLYTPGSTFKPCVGLAALKAGVIIKDSTVTCNHIYTYFNDYRPQCEGYHGSISLKMALAYSCNIFFYDVGRRTGIDNIYNTAHSLGLGELTGLELSEAEGQIASPEEREAAGGTWQAGDVIQAAIGQSDTMVTPIQLACYMMALANDGTRYRAHLVKSTQESGSDDVEETEIEVKGVAEGSEQNYADVREGMVAVSRSGSGRRAFANYRYDVASKTGTPQVSSGSCNAVYVCYGPVENARAAIAIVLEHGGNSVYLAPLAKDVMDAYFKYFGE